MPSQATPGRRLDEMRRKAPLIQCITNFVAMEIAANVLLAAGASPAMVHAEEEAGAFAEGANAVTINIGTLSAGWVNGMKAAAEGAGKAGRPWILDPVAHFISPFRRQATAELLSLRPSVVRGNASEIIALGGGASAGRGADSGDPVDAAREAASTLARTAGAVVAVTGLSDFVTDGHRAAVVHGGSALMPKVTALGCSLTALVGGFVGADPQDPFEGTVAALALFAVAGEAAGRHAEGPGSFSWRFLDQLAGTTGAELDATARIERP